MDTVNCSTSPPPRSATPPPAPLGAAARRDARAPGASDPEKTSAAAPRDAGTKDALEAGPRVRALPRRVPVRRGFPKVAPSRANEALAMRVNALLPQLVREVRPALQDRTGWDGSALDAMQVELVDRAGMRAMLRTQEGYGVLAAFFLSWVMPVVYAPAMARVLVVAPTARRYRNDTLRFQLARALVTGVVAHKHRDFYGYVADRMASPYARPHDIYACRAWAQALGDSVATQLAPSGRRGPWWQRLGMVVLWPFALNTVGPQRLARRFVPILEEVARGENGPELVDRMFAFPTLCHPLYDARGKRVLTFAPKSGYRYKRDDFRDDVRYLRQFNRHAGATYYTVED